MQAQEQCTNSEIYIVIRQPFETSSSPFDWKNVEFLWKMKGDKFQWTVWHPMKSIGKVYLYITVNVINLTTTDNDLHSHYSINIAPNHATHNCKQMIRVEHQIEKEQESVSIPLDKTRLSHEMFCIFFSCYFPYIRKNVSWNSADIFCRENKQQLLTINSDVKSKFIDSILFRGIWSPDFNMYYSPVIFLNMKQDNKVCNMMCQKTWHRI